MTIKVLNFIIFIEFQLQIRQLVVQTIITFSGYLKKKSLDRCFGRIKATQMDCVYVTYLRQTNSIALPYLGYNEPF